MPTYTVDNVSWSYSDTGAGRPLVLVHGFPLDLRMWQHQIDHFSGRFRVIAPDLRGFGKSESSQPFTIASLASDLRALLRGIDALPCVLAGLSMGGYVALAYAKMCPTDLTGLILADTRAAGDTADGKAARNKMIETVRSGGAKSVAEQMLPKMLSDHTRAHQPRLEGTMRDMMEHCSPTTIEHALTAMRDREDYTDELPSIAIPTLILVGEHDALTPPDLSRAMHERIPRSQLAIIPNAGHMSPLENPAHFNRQLDQFLDRVTGTHHAG